MVENNTVHNRPHWTLYICITFGVISANVISIFLEPHWPGLDSIFGAGIVCGVGAFLGGLVYYGIVWLLKAIRS